MLLPVRYLKIDTSFVSDAAPSPEDQAMLQGIVAIARELGVLTVAEGIEDAPTLDLVTEMASTTPAQGFHIGRPAPVG
jgi:EAL domain-containing protein (putative c-di-GMP-specific phosphodiesterase class I)